MSQNNSYRESLRTYPSTNPLLDPKEVVVEDVGRRPE